MLVERRGKHDQGHVRPRDVPKHFEAVHGRHLDIEEHEIRLQGPDALDGVLAVAELAHDLHVVERGQPEHQPPAGQRLVVDDDGAELLHVSHGIAIITLRPHGRPWVSSRLKLPS